MLIYVIIVIIVLSYKIFHIVFDVIVNDNNLN